MPQAADAANTPMLVQHSLWQSNQNLETGNAFKGPHKLWRPASLPRPSTSMGKFADQYTSNSMYYTGYPTSPQPTPAMDIAIDLRV